MYDVQNITVDISKQFDTHYLNTTQFDTLRIFQVTVLDQGEPFDLGGLTAKFSVNQNGTNVQQTCTIFENVVYVQGTRELTCVKGSIPFQILLLKNNKVTYTIAGTLYVYDTLIDFDGVDWTERLQRAEDQVNEIKSYCEGGTGTRPGEDTDNAEYYANIINTDHKGIVYKGSIGFAQLATVEKQENYMYRILDKFKADASFESVDVGYNFPAGTMVLYNSSGKWDAMQGRGAIGLYNATKDQYDFGLVRVNKHHIGLMEGKNIAFSDEEPVDNSDMWFKPYTGIVIPDITLVGNSMGLTPSHRTIPIESDGIYLAIMYVAKSINYPGTLNCIVTCNGEMIQTNTETSEWEDSGRMTVLTYALMRCNNGNLVDFAVQATNLNNTVYIYTVIKLNNITPTLMSTEMYSVQADCAVGEVNYDIEDRGCYFIFAAETNGWGEPEVISPDVTGIDPEVYDHVYEGVYIAKYKLFFVNKMKHNTITFTPSTTVQGTNTLLVVKCNE